ncbi:altered inheritance of mitochondria 6 [Fusarium beomiforme]|uniref:Altered inheritance of mitochondria protein 6 n=1 Tax=Fusarium beomiforme TaxID=44412 RepID=A0A9P5DRW7_9HYPO|nr:altered inheritance of mitochondria 6 [Fusarium beomiforme]
MTSQDLKILNGTGKGVPGLKAKTHPYILALGLIGAAITSMILMFAAVLAITPTLWSSVSEVQASSLHTRSGPGPDITLPVPCHSHNDYWRPAPFYSAIEAGCIGIEADVWNVQNELYVGHDLGDLSSSKTLSRMYIHPLVESLLARNIDRDPSLPPRGIYPRKPDQTVVLLVDLKADPDTSWPLLLNALEPLRRKGWLSYVSDGQFVSRPITVVGTGETEFHHVDNATPSRDVFFDAPLRELEQGQYNNTNSYYASVSFEQSIGPVGSKGLMPEQLAKLRRQISQAHNRGLKTRYWGMPYWPLRIRNQLRELLLDEGVDVLNVDNLLEARDIFAQRGHLIE